MNNKPNQKRCGRCRKQYDKDKIISYPEFNNPNGVLCPTCAIHVFSPEKYIEKLNKIYTRAINKDRVNYFKSLII